MFVELVEYGITKRGKIVPYAEVSIAPRNYEAYMSLYPFDKEIVGYVNTNGSIANFKGKHACKFICIDIDNEKDIIGSQNSAIKVVERLNSIYGINPDELFIYYSGNKGFHIYLVDRILGTTDNYYDNIGDKCKSFIGDILDGIENIDGKIYEDHRIMRIPNSLHAKTKRYKIELTFDELKGDIFGIYELSSQPRHITRKVIYQNIHINNKLSEDFFRHFNKRVDVQPNKKVGGDGVFWGAMERGNRNDGYYKQACALFKYSELSEKSILSIISAINSASSEPLSQFEIERIVLSASRENSRGGDGIAKIYTFGDAIPIWIDSIRQEMNTMTFGFAVFDRELKGKLRGKVCDIIGYSGSKKSLFSQWVAYLNISSGCRVLYSSMEMGVSDLMARAINMVVEPERFTASYEFEQMYKERPQDVEKFLGESVQKIYSDKLIMTDASSMTSKKYDSMIEEITTKIGNVDMLVVDGLGMMGGDADEVKRYSQASKELKELAKKWNIFVILICHLSKGAERDSKDVTDKIRGSEKIIDNCDFHVTMSQYRLTDDKGNINYNNPYGNARLVNKRGSGNIIDRFFRINTQQLLFNEFEEVNVKNSFMNTSIFE